MNEILLPPKHESWPRGGFLKKAIFSAAGAFGLGGLYAGEMEQHWFRIERRDMPLPGLGDELVGRTIAHVSDLHCSPFVLQRYLRRCVDLINSLDVDFVVITGDFIGGRRRQARLIADILGDLEPSIATVACLGNHDYGVVHPNRFGHREGLAWYITEKLAHADVFVMTNESRIFRIGKAALQFVGVEDYWTRWFDPKMAFEHAAVNLPTIGLSHNPDAAPIMAALGADWVLAGHTHGTDKPDTKWTDMWFPTNNKHFHAGHYDLDGGKNLYVNRGLAYGRRRNLNARPEVTVFTLTNADDV